MDAAMHNTMDQWNSASPADLRGAVRQGVFSDPTSGLAGGFVQANVVILPATDAADFMRFCQANPKPCPLLAVSEPGQRCMPGLGKDLDVARDVPRYRVFRNGRVEAEPMDIVDLWRDDFVSFALGCSFTFDHLLLTVGIPVRHIELGRNVSMYNTSLPLQAAGPFRGNMVVSMRPLRPADAIRAIQISTRFPMVHGAPLHLGSPEAIGIRDLSTPDYGHPVPLRSDEVPVFWACGVTPQRVLEQAGLPLAITHSPGHMLVTDLRDHEIAIC